jgi:hypothetical protein
MTSLQYTSMNTLAYADVNGEQASSASTIASTTQQLAISFGVAISSLTAAFFVPDRSHTTGPEMIHGIHGAWRMDCRFHPHFPEIENRRWRQRQSAQGRGAGRRQRHQHWAGDAPKVMNLTLK